MSTPGDERSKAGYGRKMEPCVTPADELKLYPAATMFVTLNVTVPT
jgi:hypothetical protein